MNTLHPNLRGAEFETLQVDRSERVAGYFHRLNAADREFITGILDAEGKPLTSIFINANGHNYESRTFGILSMHDYMKRNDRIRNPEEYPIEPGSFLGYGEPEDLVVLARMADQIFDVDNIETVAWILFAKSGAQDGQLDMESFVDGVTAYANRYCQVI